MSDGDSKEASGTAAWQSRDFRFYQSARLLGVLGSEAQSVGVAWQVYQITHSALALGYTGLALFLPGLVFVLPAGHVADRYDKRGVILTCYSVQAIATIVLLWLSLHATTNIWPVYLTLFVIGTGRCFSGPAASALVPSLVPKEHFVNAVTWGATVFQIANASGPMFGGLAVYSGSWREPGEVQRRAAGLCFYADLPVCVPGVGGGVESAAECGGEPEGLHPGDGFLAGLRYVRQTRLLLGSISLDLFAVLFGGATALMPIFAHDVLHSGPQGLGLLRAMPSLGALTVSLLLLRFPLRRKAGRLMLICVGIFGAATVLFGLSRSLLLSCAALVVIGASDMVSVVVRSSVLQLATPPEMRGRVSAVNWLFLGASNEFGEYESGLTAHWWGAVRAVVIGGMASMAVTGLWSVFFPALRRADRLTAESLVAAEREFSGAEPMD